MREGERCRESNVGGRDRVCLKWLRTTDLSYPTLLMASVWFLIVTFLLLQLALKQTNKLGNSKQNTLTKTSVCKINTQKLGNARMNSVLCICYDAAVLLCIQYDTGYN